jgi:hypothetical protein
MDHQLGPARLPDGAGVEEKLVVDCERGDSPGQLTALVRASVIEDEALEAPPGTLLPAEYASMTAAFEQSHSGRSKVLVAADTGHTLYLVGRWCRRGREGRRQNLRSGVSTRDGFLLDRVPTAALTFAVSSRYSFVSLPSVV